MEIRVYWEGQEIDSQAPPRLNRMGWTSETCLRLARARISTKTKLAAGVVILALLLLVAMTVVLLQTDRSQKPTANRSTPQENNFTITSTSNTPTPRTAVDQLPAQQDRGVMPHQPRVSWSLHLGLLRQLHHRTAFLKQTDWFLFLQFLSFSVRSKKKNLNEHFYYLYYWRLQSAIWMFSLNGWRMKYDIKLT